VEGVVSNDHPYSDKVQNRTWKQSVPSAVADGYSDRIYNR
jgi:hypothetical protein